MHKPSKLGNFPHIYKIYMTKTQNIMMNGWNSLTKGTKQAEQPLAELLHLFVLCLRPGTEYWGEA